MDAKKSDVCFKRSRAMCTNKMINYTCGCSTKMEFIQCEEHRGTMYRCAKVEKEMGKNSVNYCERHLIKSGAVVCKPNPEGGVGGRGEAEGGGGG